jgi:hypothetical protein
MIHRDRRVAVDSHEAVRRPVVVDAQRHARVARERMPLHRTPLRLEHERAVVVEQEPDRRHERRPVLANDRQLRRSGSFEEKRLHVVWAELAHEGTLDAAPPARKDVLDVGEP